ncbi:MAG: glycosyltransferase [Desulfomonile tiedjei]|uniref:Glycosyltransferase n=1 Tax=Desulfomonile tiedjei TaxID=2358 RepID=A0A9D6UXB1_9BACT|nr:glycosyltransferase [Desulfomonile tiedjei]
MPQALFCASNCWESFAHVGSHHLAVGLARHGWRVAFVSDPVSPLHLVGGLSPELRARFALWASGGQWVQENIWTWLPGVPISPHNKPLLRTEAVQRHWYRLAVPSLISRMRKAGFDGFDLVYVDSLPQAYWWRGLKYCKSLFRMADNPVGFLKHTPAAQSALSNLVAHVDIVAYTAENLGPLVDALGAKQTLFLPNGVDYDHFAIPAPRPAEYEGLGSIVLYMGTIEEWFNFEWVRHAARALPGHTFVLVGSDSLARQRLGNLPNVRILGPRPFSALPAYVQHASVGIIPFDVSNCGALVHAVNPIKLYEYMAAGLPVVSTRWDLLEQLQSPAVLVDDAECFVNAIAAAPKPPLPESRAFASGCIWEKRVDTLLRALRLEDPDGFCRTDSLAEPRQ